MFFRSELGLALLDGFIYAVGGWEGSAKLESVERYETNANVWSYVAPMKLAVTSPAVVALEGKSRINPKRFDSAIIEYFQN